MTNTRWEILLEIDDFEDFTALMEEHGCSEFTSTRFRGRNWITCYPPEEAKVVAILKFKLDILPDTGNCS